MPTSPHPADVKPLIAKLASGTPWSEAEASAAFEIMMTGDATPSQIGAILMALRVRGESVDEIVGATKVMRAKANRIEAPAGAIDTCGTGGDGSGSFNVSTAVSFVIAACGIPVAKHGNRAVSSKSGAADVLRALGVNLDCPFPAIERSLRELGVGFLMAPRHHSAVRHVMSARIDLATRTIFNLLGPLSNPAGAKRQLLGVYDPRWTEPLAQVLGRLGSEAAWVVHGSDGMDELTITGPSQVTALATDGSISTFTITPADAGLVTWPAEAITGGAPEENAARMRSLFTCRTGGVRDIVLLNAAAGLVVAGAVGNLRDGAARAAAAIDDGTALGTLDAYVALTQQATEE
jgi:anthranilate phosphoribosyltransferase